MDILSFAFGVVLMFAIMLIVGGVIVTVKVYKQSNYIKNIDEYVNEVQRNFNSESLSRDQALYDMETKIYQEITRVSDAAINHTDSRVDKLQSKIQTGTKEALKG